MQQENKLTPEFFYEQVAKKTHTDVEIVREIYTLYLRRVSECIRTEKKVMVRGLGTFELSPKKILRQLYIFADFIKRNPEEYVEESQLEKRVRWYGNMSDMIKQLLKLRLKYEYIDRSLEKLRANHERFDNMFDEEGNCKINFKTIK